MYDFHVFYLILKNINSIVNRLISLSHDIFPLSRITFRKKIYFAKNFVEKD